MCMGYLSLVRGDNTVFNSRVLSRHRYHMQMCLRSISPLTTDGWMLDNFFLNQWLMWDFNRWLHLVWTLQGLYVVIWMGDRRLGQFVVVVRWDAIGCVLLLCWGAWVSRSGDLRSGHGWLVSWGSAQEVGWLAEIGVRLSYLSVNSCAVWKWLLFLGVESIACRRCWSWLNDSRGVTRVVVTRGRSSDFKPLLAWQLVGCSSVGLVGRVVVSEISCWHAMCLTAIALIRGSCNWCTVSRLSLVRVSREGWLIRPINFFFLYLFKLELWVICRLGLVEVEGSEERIVHARMLVDVLLVGDNYCGLELWILH